MTWNTIVNALSFTGVTDTTVWQDVAISAIIIPLSLFLFSKLTNWLSDSLPLSLLFKGFLEKNNNILIFLSQLTALDDQERIDQNPKYVIRYPTPSPTNKNAITLTPRRNIDPVWSEGDGECLADIYNTLGKAGRSGNVEVTNLVKGWDNWSNPIVSIGFNPKTINNLIKKCSPIYFEITQNTTLKIIENNMELDCLTPNDAAIIQKTKTKNTNVPVFILAGHGTTGTSAAGYFLRENCVTIGKLYGSRSFCLLLYVNIVDGRSSVSLKAAYPRPSLGMSLLHPFVFYRAWKMSVFPKLSRNNLI
ncbi:hypothetical protein KKB64_04560 [Patescibacteria group bacterium]|nr:hypothetical protein [Patescibacteria group bacterium]MBU1473022.1 hypothetical protein [Patescibacteria group bacterium]